MIGRSGVILLAVALAMLIGCAGLPDPAAWPPVAADEVDEMPPIARLLLPGTAAAGALGSFAYREAYSDSPWLAASSLPPVAVPAGRPQLTIALPPGRQFVRWSATYAAADDPSAAVIAPLADGAGDERGRTRIDSPPAGAWVIQVHLTFVDSEGDAAYYWHVVVP
jgi:hypothetical protein